MAQIIVQVLVPILLVLVAGAGATPPGIAKNPSHASCKIKKYKHCYNLVHVCPKFCPDECTVECASCKPICVGSANPPPDSPTPSTPENPPPSSSTPTPSTPENPPPSSSTPTPSTPENPPPSSSTPTPSTPQNPPPSSSTPSPPSPTFLTPRNPPPPTSTPPSSPTPTNPPPSSSTSSPTTPSPSPSTPPSITPPSPSPPSSTTPSPTTPSPSTPSPTIPSPSTPSPTTPSPSTPSPTTPSPSTPSPTIPSPSTPPSINPPSGPRTARCRNKNYSNCYNMEHVCPNACPGGCEVDCVTCKPVCKCDRPGAVCQDPRFIGGDGITFYFHGKKESNFCLLSDPNLHINAHFIGRRNDNMKRDFTWVQSIAILFDNHQLFLGALKTATWEDYMDRIALTFDGQPITLHQSEGATWTSSTLPSVSIVRTASTNSVTVEVEGRLRVTAKVVPITEQDSRIHNYGVTKEDCFAHLDLGFKFFTLSNEVSGVLGQTYNPNYVSRVDVGAKMPVLGGGREFETTTLFSPDCYVARFVGTNQFMDKELSQGDNSFAI